MNDSAQCRNLPLPPPPRPPPPKKNPPIDL